MRNRFADGLNREQLQEVLAIARELPAFSEDLSEIDLMRHTLVGALIDRAGNILEKPQNNRQANIMQGRFRLLMNIDIYGVVAQDHYTRLEYLAKEVWREVGKTEDEIREILADPCDCAEDDDNA